MMQVVCSPVGFIEARSPRQGIKDMLGTGLKSTVLDVNLFCWYDVKRHGWDMARFHKKLDEANDVIKAINDGGISFAIADGPLWGYPRVGKPDERCLMELTREAMRIAAQNGVGTIMVHPSKFEDAKSLLPLAKELHLHLLIKNETRSLLFSKIFPVYQDPRVKSLCISSPVAINLNHSRQSYQISHLLRGRLESSALLP